MDDLIDLLTYECPITGKKRTAGHYDDSNHENPGCLG